MSRKIDVFTDGACSGNPGPGGWGAVLLGPDTQVLEIGGAATRTSNQEMELMALVKALELMEAKSWLEGFELSFYIDSEYVLNGVRSWGAQWMKNGWLTQAGKPVLHREIWERILRITRQLPGAMWISVRGHRGHPVNARADRIAVGFSRGESVKLFSGSLPDYSEKSVLQWTKAPQDSKPYSQPIYLSVVDGKIARDTDWNACKERTKGKKGARFKKVHSLSEERETLQLWGIE